MIFGYPGPLVERIISSALSSSHRPIPGDGPLHRPWRVDRPGGQERESKSFTDYEWPPAIEAWLVAPHGGRHVVAVGTVMSMAVAPFLPRTYHSPLALTDSSGGRDPGRFLTRSLNRPWILS